MIILFRNVLVIVCDVVFGVIISNNVPAVELEMVVFSLVRHVAIGILML